MSGKTQLVFGFRIQGRTMSRTFRIAGLGEVLWDAFPEGEAFGGAPANFACHCGSLGAEAFIVSCIGDDNRGRLAREFLDGHGVDTSGLVVNSEVETGVVTQRVRPPPDTKMSLSALSGSSRAL